jgi:hypothetical protein
MKIPFVLHPSYFLLLTFCAVSLNARPTSAETSQPEQASAIAKIVQNAMKTERLRAFTLL